MLAFGISGTVSNFTLSHTYLTITLYSKCYGCPVNLLTILIRTASCDSWLNRLFISVTQDKRG